jgi:uncharacterized protein (DUF362 family)
MAKVFIKEATYDPERLKTFVGEMLESRGSEWISAGTRVLVKPNLLMPARPDQAIVTHPYVVRAVVAYLLDKGATVQVSDSQGVGSFRKIFIESGYADALKDMDVTVRSFKESVQVDIGEPFGSVEIAKEAIEADVVINLAKLKTHTQMYLTLGVKNIFGTVVGLRKPEWHMRAGVDRRLFARLLVQIYEAVAPGFTLVDGILALEGQGPARSGRPRELGLLVGGANGHAVDKTICTLLGMNPADLLTCSLARDLGVYDGIVHASGDICIVDDFCFPELHSLSLGPESLNRFMRKYVIHKPLVDNALCKLCGECWKICPARAIDHNIKGVQFDYDGCIRCYCCLEVCLHGAIHAKEPLLGKLWRLLIRNK